MFEPDDEHTNRMVYTVVYATCCCCIYTIRPRICFSIRWCSFVCLFRVGFSSFFFASFVLLFCTFFERRTYKRVYDDFDDSEILFGGSEEREIEYYIEKMCTQNTHGTKLNETNMCTKMDKNFSLSGPWRKAFVAFFVCFLFSACFFSIIFICNFVETVCASSDIFGSHSDLWWSKKERFFFIFSLLLIK